MSTGLRSLKWWFRARLGPVRLMGARPPSGGRLLFTFGLPRCGQHLIIDWICRGLGEMTHFNHCRFFPSGLGTCLAPATGRRVVYSGGEIDDSGVKGRWQDTPATTGTVANSLYSMEIMRLDAQLMHRVGRQEGAQPILIVRDPYNWIASSLKHELSTEAQIERLLPRLRRHLENAAGLRHCLFVDPVVVDYGRFVCHADYRMELARRLDIPESRAVDLSLERVPDFGSGSSFGGKSQSELGDVFRRWMAVADHPLFQSLAQDREIHALTRQVFGTFPSLEEIEARFDLA